MTLSIVLLPGLDGSGEQFAPLIAALGSEITPIVVRYPSDGDVTLEAHAATARSALPTDRRCFLLGESFSGPIAVRIAATAPAGLAGLILCASFARFPRPRLRFLKPLGGLISPPMLPVWLVASFVLGGSARRPLRRLLDRSMRGVTPQALRARVLAVFDFDVRSELASVKVPILYLRAARDRLVPASAAREVAAIARQTVVADLDAPHFLLQAVPEDAARVIRRFVDGAAYASD